LGYLSTPDDWSLIMVDPKTVERQVFNNVPHMLIPVVTGPKKFQTQCNAV
jgi:S-DNA-T family DNA segregation ATPase FtsK/SpoIIIE